MIRILTKMVSWTRRSCGTFFSECVFVILSRGEKPPDGGLYVAGSQLNSLQYLGDKFTTFNDGNPYFMGIQTPTIGLMAITYTTGKQWGPFRPQHIWELFRR